MHRAGNDGELRHYLQKAPLSTNWFIHLKKTKKNCHCSPSPHWFAYFLQATQKLFYIELAPIFTFLFQSLIYQATVP